MPKLLKTLTADEYDRMVKSRAFASAVIGIAATTALAATSSSSDNEVVSDIAAVGAVVAAQGTVLGVSDKLESRHTLYYDYLKKTSLESIRSAHGIMLAEYGKRYKALVLRMCFGDGKTHSLPFYPDPKARIVRYELN